MSGEIVIIAGKSGLELALVAWLDAKRNRSRSFKTLQAYRDGIESFRRQLQSLGLDLEGDTTAVATIAQAWAGLSVRGEEVEPNTYNQRLAIISSFYAFALKRGLLKGENPISRVERRPVQSYGKATWLTPQEGKTKLAAIDRSSLSGKRDYALLSVAIQTGRRLSELAGLTWGDLRAEEEKITISWRRTKGGKSTRDTLPAGTSRAILDWLEAYYGAKMKALPKNAAVWVSLSPRNRGEALGIQTVADICQKRLGLSKVHSLRHTFARAMEDAGAKVSDIQARLGHSSLATTGRYLAALNQAENQHANKIAEMFGLE